MKAPGSRLRELEEASEGWRFRLGHFEGLSRSLHWHLAIALALYSSITQVRVNTRKQWPTYLTSGSCTSRHSTIALLATLTLLTFVPFGVARRRVEAKRRTCDHRRTPFAEWTDLGPKGMMCHVPAAFVAANGRLSARTLRATLAPPDS